MQTSLLLCSSSFRAFITLLSHGLYTLSRPLHNLTTLYTFPASIRTLSTPTGTVIASTTRTRRYCHSQGLFMLVCGLHKNFKATIGPVSLYRHFINSLVAFIGTLLVSNGTSMAITTISRPSLAFFGPPQVLSRPLQY
jgi:hypothetical protein